MSLVEKTQNGIKQTQGSYPSEANSLALLNNPHANYLSPKKPYTVRVEDIPIPNDLPELELPPSYKSVRDVNAKLLDDLHRRIVRNRNRHEEVLRLRKPRVRGRTKLRKRLFNQYSPVELFFKEDHKTGFDIAKIIRAVPRAARYADRICTNGTLATTTITQKISFENLFSAFSKKEPASFTLTAHDDIALSNFEEDIGVLAIHKSGAIETLGHVVAVTDLTCVVQVNHLEALIDPAHEVIDRAALAPQQFHCLLFGVRV